MLRRLSRSVTNPGARDAGTFDVLKPRWKTRDEDRGQHEGPSPDMTSAAGSGTGTS
jgi:hypothetical protein